MEIRRSRWEFDKQIIIDIIKIKGNCIILKMQKYGSMALPRKKNPTITKNKASVRLFKHKSQKNTRKFNKHDKKQGIDLHERILNTLLTLEYGKCDKCI